MKLGLFTACLPGLPLEQIVPWAATHEFDALEVAAWPADTDRPFTTAHVDARHIDAGVAERVRTLFESHHMTLSSLGFYGNNLHPDRRERAATHEHLRAVIEAAGLLECPTVGTFIGGDPTRTIRENLVEAERIFPAFVDQAGQHGVKVVIENCYMESWHPDGYAGNLAYSPELWEWMFDLGLYLNYDPSHLVWLGIDPLEALRPYLDRIPHAQAKDVQLFPDRRTRFGWTGSVRHDDAGDGGWWRYRVPGLGQVDWAGLVDALYEGGFDGALSVEHEDPVWGGTEDKVKAGLRIAARTLRPLILREE